MYFEERNMYLDGGNKVLTRGETCAMRGTNFCFSIGRKVSDMYYIVKIINCFHPQVYLNGWVRSMVTIINKCLIYLVTSVI